MLIGCGRATYEYTARGRSNRPTGIRVVQFEKVEEIAAGLLPYLLRRKPAKLCDFARNLHHKCWLVSLPAVRNGREERRISLNKHAIQRNFTGRIANVLCFRKSDIPRNRNHKPELERSP